MTQFQRAFGDLAILVIGIATIAAVVAAVASYRRSKDGYRAAAAALLAGSLVCTAGVTLQPAPGPAGFELVPFGNLSSPSGADQLSANLLLMIPTGFALGLLRPLRIALLIGMAVCAGIEAVQLVPALGRVAATEDFLLTTTGCAVGALVANSGAAGCIAVLRARRNSA